MKSYSVAGIKITVAGSRVTLASGRYAASFESFYASAGMLECGDAVTLVSPQTFFRVSSFVKNNLK